MSLLLDPAILELKCYTIYRKNYYLQINVFRYELLCLKNVKIKSYIVCEVKTRTNESSI